MPDPLTILTLAMKYGPEVKDMLGSLLGGGPTPGQTGPRPGSEPTPFQLGISESMGIPPRNEASGGGFSLGLPGGDGASLLSPGPTDHLSAIAEGPPPSGNVFDGTPPADPGGSEVAGAGPSALEKLGMGAQVGQTLAPKLPPPPSLPGGGRFDMPNSILQWMQAMRRR